MTSEIKDNLINFKLSSGIRNILIGMIALGIISFVLGFFVFNHGDARHGHSNPAWSALLVGTFLILGVAIAGGFFTAISHITGSHWSVTIRRITENYGRAIPAVLILMVIIFFGIHDLFEWSHPEVVQADKLIKHKSGFLNVPFFIGRIVVFLIVWSAFGYIFHRKSVKQDQDKDASHTQFNAKLSGGFIVFFAISFTVTAFDLLMSLTPHWYSTMWGVYVFAGAYQTGLASIALMIYVLKKSGYLGELVNDNHIHDVGKFMLSFCVFWAYIAFSQFMLIWYANMPEETFWYEQRLTGGWTLLSIILPFIKFVIPFLLLLNRPNKRDINFLSKVAIWIIIAEAIELYWIVFPSNFITFSTSGLLITLGVSVGTVGLFSLIVFKGLESAKLIPVGDPRLEQCLHHHQ